jgi:hypothetical protein
VWNPRTHGVVCGPGPGAGIGGGFIATAPVALAVEIIFIRIILVVIRGTAFIHQPSGSGAVDHLLPGQTNLVARRRIGHPEAGTMKIEISGVRVEMADKIGAVRIRQVQGHADLLAISANRIGAPGILIAGSSGSVWFMFQGSLRFIYPPAQNRPCRARDAPAAARAS